MTHPIHAVLLEHSPRACSDPLYVPYWAKDRREDFTYRLADGTVIRAGRVIHEGTGKFPERAAPPRVESVELRIRARLTHEAATKTSDTVLALVRANPGRGQREALCEKYGIDPAILEGAPNAGVATMRLVNALRRVGLQG